MYNTIGKNISLTLFGESHGKVVGACLDGIPAGLSIPYAYLEEKLRKRRASGPFSTTRQEPDEIHFLSGVYENKTQGNPITFVLENKRKNSKEYQTNKARPSHADYVAFEKYFHHMNMAGGGPFSGRMTAALVVAGAFCQKILEDQGIDILGHIEQIQELKDRSFGDYSLDKEILLNKEFPVLEDEVESQMKTRILSAKEEKDSLGAILECNVVGLPAGLGNPYFSSLESELSKAIFSIPAVKGISFGLGFEFSNHRGSQVNDVFYLNDGIKTKTNHNGGINGGISNGMPLVFHVAIKPTSSIGKEQESIDLKENKLTLLEIKGRHDPLIAHRALVVVEAMTAFVLLDAYIERQKECLWER